MYIFVVLNRFSILLMIFLLSICLFCWKWWWKVMLLMWCILLVWIFCIFFRYNFFLVIKLMWFVRNYWCWIWWKWMLLLFVCGKIRWCCLRHLKLFVCWIFICCVRCCWKLVNCVKFFLIIVSIFCGINVIWMVRILIFLIWHFLMV